MPRFSVHIGERTRSFEAPLGANEPIPPARDVYWEDDADHEGAAKESAYRAWDEKYGPGRRPLGAIVRVTDLDA